MVSNSTDRFNGVVASKAIKAPCAVATSANIALTGAQTISGVAVTTGDRVLVRAQTNSVENGIYDVKSGAWERSADWDGNRDVAQGTLITAFDSAGDASQYILETADPIYIGTTAVSIVLYSQGVSVAVAGGTTQHAVLRWDGVDTYREAERIQVTQQGAEFRIYASNLTDYGEFTYSGSVLALSLNDPAHQIFVSNDLVVTGADLYVAGDGLVYLGEQVGPGAGVGGQGIWWTGVGTPGVPYFMGDGSTKYKLSSEQELHYGFDTDTTATDPGAGDVKFNNAALNLATAMYISDTPDSGQDASWILDNLAEGDIIKLVSASSSTQYLIALVSGPPVDNTGWWNVPITPIYSGTAFDLFQVISFEVEWFSQASSVADGTVTDSMLAWDGANWSEETNLRYNDTTKELAIYAAGTATTDDSYLALRDSGGTLRATYGISSSGSDLLIESAQIGQGVEIRAVNNGSSNVALFNADPDNTTTLNCATGMNFSQGGLTSTFMTYSTTAGLQFKDAAGVGTASVMRTRSQALGGGEFQQTYQNGDTWARILTENQMDHYGPAGHFEFNTTTTMADPPAGDIRFNSATPASVTQLAVSDVSTLGSNDMLWLWASVSAGDIITIKSDVDMADYLIATIDTVTNNTTWYQLDITVLASGSLPANNDPLNVSIQYVSKAAVVADGTQTDAMLRWSGSAWVENTTARLEAGNAKLVLNNVADIITGFNDTSVPFAIGNKTSGGTFFSFDAYGRMQAQAASAAAAISINTDGGSVSIGDTSSPAATHIINLNNYLVRVTNGTMEIASAADDKFVTTGYGQLWVKNDTPERMFYSDGNDTKWPLQSVHEAEYAYSSTVTAADPGTATLRFNSVTIGSITEMYIDDLALSEDWGWILSNLADGDILVIKSAVDPADYIIASVNGAPTDNTGWWTVQITLIHTGTIFTDGDPLRIEVQWFSQAGASLPSGTTTDAVLKWSGAAWVEETGVRIDNATQQLRVYDNTGETDYIGLRHNDIDAFIECTNTTNLDFDGFSVARFRGASSLQVYDGDNSAYVDIQASDSVAVISTGIAGDLELNAVGGDVRIALGDNFLVRGGSLVVYDSAALDTFTVDVGATDVDFIMGGSVAPIRYKFQDAPIFMEERAAAEVDVLGYGQIWVSSVDSHLYFTDDGGTDYQISGTGGGNVSNTGTPLDNQIAVWTNATTIEGDANLTWDATTLLVTGTIAAGNAEAGAIVNEVPSSVNPTLLPRRSDDNTGIGSAVADTVSIIAGGIEFVRFNESTNNTCDFYVPIFLEEQALANPDVSGWGQIWVESTTTPANRMGFTDDTGEDSYYGAFGIEFNENATRPYGAPGAGKGMLWIVNTNPCELLYQSDIDQTFALINLTNDFLYQFSTTTTAADPGQGFIRWNNATPASVTAIYVDNLDLGGSRNLDNDIGSLRRGDVVHIVAQQNNTRYGFFSVESVTDNTGWWTISVTPIGTGTLPTNNEPIHLEFHRSGYQTLQDYAIEDPGEYTPTGTTQTLTYSDGPAFQVDLESVTGNITITLSGGPPTGTYGQITIKVTQDSTVARTITWAGGTFRWPGGTAHPMNSTLNGFSLYNFETWDGGTTWWGAGADYS